MTSPCCDAPILLVRAKPDGYECKACGWDITEEVERMKDAILR